MFEGVRNAMFGSEESEESSDLEDEGFDMSEPEDAGFSEEEEEEDEIEDPDPEWDTLYQMVDDVVKQCGFSGLNECIERSMMFKVKKSGMYRNRISSGLEVIETMRDVEDKLSGGGGETDLEQTANRINQANQVVDAVEDFTDSEEMTVRRITNVANKAIDTYSKVNSGGSSGGGGVDVSTVRKDEEI